jgi:hypothetical protein
MRELLSAIAVVDAAMFVVEEAVEVALLKFVKS